MGGGVIALGADRVGAPNSTGYGFAKRGLIPLPLGRPEEYKFKKFKNTHDLRHTVSSATPPAQGWQCSFRARTLVTGVRGGTRGPGPEGSKVLVGCLCP